MGSLRHRGKEVIEVLTRLGLKIWILVFLLLLNVNQSFLPVSVFASFTMTLGVRKSWFWEIPFAWTTHFSWSSVLVHSKPAADFSWWFTEVLLSCSIANCHVKTCWNYWFFLQRNYCSHRFHFCQGNKMVLISSLNRSWFRSQPWMPLRSCLAFLKTKSDFQSFYF